VTLPIVPPDALPPLATSGDYSQLVPGDPPAGIDTLLAQASAAVRNYCGWHVAPKIQQTWQLDGLGVIALRLPTLELVDLLSVSNEGTPLDPATVQWSHDGYLRRIATGCGYSDGYWTTAYRGVIVEAVHGFDLAAVGDLTALVVSMTARAAASPTGETQQTVGGVTVKMGSVNGSAVGSVGAMAPDELAALGAYRLFGVA
jgi:hypothetical protein